MNSVGAKIHFYPIGISNWHSIFIEKTVFTPTALCSLCHVSDYYKCICLFPDSLFYPCENIFIALGYLSGNVIPPALVFSSKLLWLFLALDISIWILQIASVILAPPQKICWDFENVLNKYIELDIINMSTLLISLTHEHDISIHLPFLISLNILQFSVILRIFPYNYSIDRQYYVFVSLMILYVVLFSVYFCLCTEKQFFFKTHLVCSDC